jgi:alkylhydroperoxidase family enzyme
MHWKDLRAGGRANSGSMDSTPGSERAALAWTDSVTNVREGHVPDEVYVRVRPLFSEKELADLTLAITAINGWTRLNIAAHIGVCGRES